MVRFKQYLKPQKQIIIDELNQILNKLGERLVKRLQINYVCQIASLLIELSKKLSIYQVYSQMNCKTDEYAELNVRYVAFPCGCSSHFKPLSS